MFADDEQVNCLVCGQDVVPKTQAIKVKEFGGDIPVFYHQECFRCERCKKRVTYKDEGSPLAYLKTVSGEKFVVHAKGCLESLSRVDSSKQ